MHWKGATDKMDSNIERELRSLEGERRLGKMAIMGYQHSIAEQLKSSMGKDMNDVLSGNKKVRLPLWQRLKHKFDVLLSYIK